MKILGLENQNKWVKQSQANKKTYSRWMSCDLEWVWEAMIRCILPVQPNLEVIRAHGVLSKRWPTSARKIFTNETNT